jgi:hypothetical protein
MHTKKNRGKIQGGPLWVWDPRTKAKPWFPSHLLDIDATVSLTKFSKGAWEIQKKSIKWKNSAWSHGE